MKIQNKNSKNFSSSASNTVSRTKAIIFDASTIISFSMNGLLKELEELKKIFNGKFLITEKVKFEAIDKPMTIDRFRLEAIKIKKLLEDRTFELPSSIGIKTSEVSKKSNEYLNIANSAFTGKKGEIHLIDLGEASCLALSDILTKTGIPNVIAIDERTTRNLCETPEELKNFLEGKLHTKINIKKENIEAFKKFKFIRSTELIYISYKKGILRMKNSGALNALLYALKYKGCAISRKEIREIESLG